MVGACRKFANLIIKQCQFNVNLSTTHFFISNLVVKAPDLNLGKQLSNLLSNREALN